MSHASLADSPEALLPKAGDRSRPIRFYPELSARQISGLRKLATQQQIPAGTWIARPGSALGGAYFVESGVVSATDESDVDFIWPGILFDAGCTFGECVLLEQPSFPSTLRALTDVKVWYLSRAAFKLLKQDRHLADLEGAIRRRVELTQILPEVVRALKRCAWTADLPASALLDLAQRCEVLNLPRRPALDRFRPGDWVFVARGEMACGSMRVPSGSSFVYVGQDGAAGVVPIAHDDRPVQVVCLRRQAHSDAAAGCVHVRHSLYSVKDGDAEHERRRKEVLAVIGDVVGLPYGALAAWLADSLWRTEDTWLPRVGLLIVGDQARPLDPPVLSWLRESTQVDVQTARPDRAREVLGEMQKRLDLVVLDSSQADADWIDNTLPELVTRAVVVSRKVTDGIAPALKHKRVVRAAMLGGSEVGEYIAYYPGAVRLAFDNPEHLGHRRSYAELTARDKGSLARLARAVLEMRMGLALGGGGSWGYAHVALLQELTSPSVDMPIDLVSGVSFGSLVGAFFTSGGVRSLDQLVKKGLAFQAYLMLSGLTPLPGLAEFYVDHCIGNKRLEYLETPFFPVGLDLNTGAEWSFGTGTLGYGVRSASALPGLLPPLIDLGKGIRSVDGCCINNVPEGVLVREGADFVIASDVMQAQPTKPESRWTSLVSVVNPLSRMSDNLRGIATLAKIGDDRDGSFANLTFRPPPTSVFPMDFRKAAEIVEGARPAARDFAARAKKHYLARMSMKRQVVGA